ncbi:PilN domain-containing protein [Paenibacillus puerhi]|uniref:PilN domain-containing protein n=1 Tax=Paenibacillus puerhi TaxID=2692622 RepID=UPI001357A11C|nr:hypothetical protein [Paenibacillus puerhi]
MNSINLLPRKPRSERLFWPVLSVTALTVVLSFGTLAVFQYKLSETSVQHAQYKQQLQARIQVLQQQHVEEPRTADYRRLLQEVKSLEGRRVDWLPSLHGITSSLPEAARLLSVRKADAAGGESSVPAAAQASQAAGLLPSQKLVALLEFSDFKQIADYVLNMKKNEIFQDVAIVSVEKKEIILPVPVAMAAASHTGIDRRPSDPTLKEKFLQETKQQKQAPLATKSEELLSELDWLISGKMYEQEHGVTLPDRRFTSENPVGSSPISEDELKKAREQVNKFEAMFEQTGPAPEEQQDTGADTPAMEKKAVVYTVNLEILTKPITITP